MFKAHTDLNFMFCSSQSNSKYINIAHFLSYKSKVFNNKYAFVAISAILFGLVHTLADLSNLLNLLYIIPYGALGLGFALMDYETKSTFTSIVMHMIHNTITCILLFAVL